MMAMASRQGSDSGMDVTWLIWLSAASRLMRAGNGARARAIP